MNYNSDTNQSIKDKLVSREVLANVNALAEFCLRAEHALPRADIPFTSEDLKNNTEDENGYFPEVLEWWIVTEWLYEKLNAENEVVVEVGTGYLWGRCCSGQAISMDRAIDRIAESMGILEGQEYDWAKNQETR